MNTTTKRVKTKPTFYDICVQNHFNSEKLQIIANMSGVPMSTITAMCDDKRIAVARSDAEKVLAAFSQYTRGNWTLDNVDVPLTNGKVGA